MKNYFTSFMWLLLASLICVGTFFGVQNPTFFALWDNYISLGILGMFLALSVNTGWATLRFDGLRQAKIDPEIFIPKETSNYLNRYISGSVEKNYFFSGVFVALGMIGTIWGFREALPALGMIDIAQPQSLGIAIKSLEKGVYIALNTTFCGLLCSILLKLQNFNLVNAMAKHDDDAEVLA